MQIKRTCKEDNLLLQVLFFYLSVELFLNKMDKCKFLQPGLFDSAEQKSHMRSGVQ